MIDVNQVLSLTDTLQAGQSRLWYLGLLVNSQHSAITQLTLE